MAFVIDELAASSVEVSSKTLETTEDTVGEAGKVVGDGIGESSLSFEETESIEDVSGHLNNTPEVVGDGISESELESAMNANSELNKILGEPVTDKWAEIRDGSLIKDVTLYNDLKNNPQLAKAFSRNPEFLKIYNNYIESSYRTDLTILRYGANNADVYRQIYTNAPSNRIWLKGENLMLKDKEGTTLIINKQNGETLGLIKGDAKVGYSIDILNKSGVALIDMAPLKNATYIYKNMIWVTDGYGRQVGTRVCICGDVVEGVRDGNFINKISQFKSGFNIQTQDFRPYTRLNDDGGHLIADSWGGPSVSINILPQNASMNRGGIWRSSEKQGLYEARNGNVVVRATKIEYPDNNTLRPSVVYVTQTVDGKIQTVNGVKMDNVRLDNIKEKKLI